MLFKRLFGQLRFVMSEKKIKKSIQNDTYVKSHGDGRGGNSHNGEENSELHYYAFLSNNPFVGNHASHFFFPFFPFFPFFFVPNQKNAVTPIPRNQTKVQRDQRGKGEFVWEWTSFELYKPYKGCISQPIQGIVIVGIEWRSIMEQERVGCVPACMSHLSLGILPDLNSIPASRLNVNVVPSCCVQTYTHQRPMMIPLSAFRSYLSCPDILLMSTIRSTILGTKGRAPGRRGTFSSNAPVAVFACLWCAMIMLGVLHLGSTSPFSTAFFTYFWLLLRCFQPIFGILQKVEPSFKQT